MTTQNFNNDSDQAERRSIERDTFLSRTQLDADRVDGRFARQTPTTIIAKDPALQYPRLPASSPWSAPDPTGVEPPLGIDVNDLGFDRSALGADVAQASGSPLAAVEIETPASILSNKLMRRV